MDANVLNMFFWHINIVMAGFFSCQETQHIVQYNMLGLF